MKLEEARARCVAPKKKPNAWPLPPALRVKATDFNFASQKWIKDRPRWLDPYRPLLQPLDREPLKTEIIKIKMMLAYRARTK